MRDHFVLKRELLRFGWLNLLDKTRIVVDEFSFGNEDIKRFLSFDANEFENMNEWLWRDIARGR